MCGETEWFPKGTSWLEKIVTGAGAAASVGTAAAGFLQETPKTGQFLTTTTGEADSEETTAEAKAARQRALARRGKSSTSLTGGLGVTNPANTGLKMLFGGK
ncbi:hypothetical protein [Pseudodesulfovibrio pelocollis]|uniref:hypothetical protein n=1 Tax=Pseudodesulfovibrio pelocollis TaxID=3051432 RepID=UPI00255A9A06|nr:hypothetical protein [Pseudodesulfovibrio sp. SB368]